MKQAVQKKHTRVKLTPEQRKERAKLSAKNRAIKAFKKK